MAFHLSPSFVKQQRSLVGFAYVRALGQIKSSVTLQIYRNVSMVYLWPTVAHLRTAQCPPVWFPQGGSPTENERFHLIKFGNFASLLFWVQLFKYLSSDKVNP